MKVGVLGGGQLARMLAQAGQALDIELLFLDPAGDACAGEYAQQLQGAYDDEDLLASLAEQTNVVTYEFENVPSRSVDLLKNQVDVHPSPQALAVAQDRLSEKTLFQQLDIPVPEFVAVDNLPALQEAIESIGLPAVLKTRHMGYDGKGQYVITEADQVKDAWQSIHGSAAILEAMVPFDREVSIIAVRSMKGECACYPLAENVHQQGILRLSQSSPDDAASDNARQYILKLLNHFQYVGVLALELFEVDGKLLANEFAPRVHNSGHWTIEGAQTSQFENHLRAVTGMPLGSTEPKGYAAMVNCVSEMCHTPDSSEGIHVHDYGKQPREERKVGHVTITADSPSVLKQRLSTFQASQ